MMLFATGAGAWEQWHSPYAEDYMPIEMWGQSSGTSDCSGNSEFSPMIRAGITWINASCSFFTFSKGGLMSGGESKDGKFNCSFDTQGFQAGVLAYTSIKSYGPYGECDIVFNDNEDWYCGTGFPGWDTDLETICLHEMGHLLGLDHTSQFMAVMYAYYNGEKRDLHSDDRDGICSMYPK